jgi:hypothetical protein
MAERRLRPVVGRAAWFRTEERRLVERLAE